MEELERENYIQIITEIEKSLSHEAYEVIGSFEKYLESTELNESKKLKINSTLRENLNKSLSFVFKILEEKLQDKIFKSSLDYYVEQEPKAIDELLSSKLQQLEEQVLQERARNSALLQDIEAGNQHLTELKQYISIISMPDISPEEEILLKLLKS